MMRRGGAGAAAFVRSLALLASIMVGVPWALSVSARARFGGSSPLHGVPSPTHWDAGRIGDALTTRLTDDTIADIVIRSALLVAWAAVVVLVLTVIAETVHMVRHDGLAMPDIRGLGVPQSAARVIASGLLVILPLLVSPSRAIARDGTSLVAGARASAALVARPRPAAAGEVSIEAGVAAPPADHLSRAATAPTGSEAAGRYVVRPGDSIYGIAERLAGPDPRDVARYAEQLVDLNLGTPMPDGQRFTNAAFIDVGWVLQLPSPAATGDLGAVAPGAHVVERGESLWSIADDELGAGARWPEIYDANAGRTFDDGRVLRDPGLIHPGWELELPADPGEAATVPGETTPPIEPTAAPGPRPPDPEIVAEASMPDATGAVADDMDQAVADDMDQAVADDMDQAVGRDGPAAARPDNVWMPKGVAAPDQVAAGSEGSGASAPPDPSEPDDGSDASGEAPRLLTVGRAAMLSAGVLALLSVRRRNQLRRARPRARLPEPAPGVVATERTLRAIDAGDRFERVDIAIRAAARSLAEQGGRVLAALVGPDGDLELRVAGPAVLPAPWHGAGDRWFLGAATPLELVAGAAREVGAPCPALVQLGRADGDRDVYVDLEAVEAIEVGGPGDQADAIVSAVAATLAGSVLAEVTTLVGVGVPDEAFLGHRLHVPARDARHAFAAAADAIGSTADAPVSTFELRARVTSGETWEPAVVLVGTAGGAVTPPASRKGLAIVSAAPVHGPSSRLAPAGDSWQLDPLGIRFVPVGLPPDDLRSIAELVESADAVLDTAPVGEAVDATDDDLTIVSPSDDALDALDGLAATSAAAGGVERPPAPVGAPTSEPAWSVLVRLLGPVRVEAPDGREVGFERSKTRELVAWLATHRERSTRTAARTALWELDVRDATFANVVSEARRSLARLVEPPDGEEWVGRTMTEALPLHDLVVTDADLLEHALDAALLQPPAQAIATLTPAVERIAGMPFEGTAYLWPDAEGLTSSLVLLATSAATELAAHCLSLGDVDGVFRATGRGLRVLPGHEELIGLRMRAHARAGDHAGIRQEWESYERVVTADPWSDGEPSPKLVELRRELLGRSR